MPYTRRTLANLVFLTCCATSVYASTTTHRIKKVAGGVIAAIVIAILVAILLCCCLIFLICRRRKKRQSNSSSGTSTTQGAGLGQSSKPNGGGIWGLGGHGTNRPTDPRATTAEQYHQGHPGPAMPQPTYVPVYPPRYRA
ncbi:hypothetical protein PNOK_0477200 [Pyrrhoderma noxium]|uniref:Uncharacterized protein n=1 Tax=Pyrrhoderma noxium TaxID=2282107 RepID=A0A286UJU7_9AGAM|nr:hypothetical protein PNOK_0477200 [Pyrrhoderma noxium]